MEFVIRCSMERSIEADVRFQSAKARGIRGAVHGFVAGRESRLSRSPRVARAQRLRMRVTAEQHVRVRTFFDGRFAQLAEGRDEAVPRRGPAGFSESTARAVGDAQHAGVGEEGERDRDSIDDTSRSTRFGSQHDCLRGVWDVVRFRGRARKHQQCVCLLNCERVEWLAVWGFAVNAASVDACNGRNPHPAVLALARQTPREGERKKLTLSVEQAHDGVCKAGVQPARFVYAVLTYEYVYVVIVNKHGAYLWTS